MSIAHRREREREAVRFGVTARLTTSGPRLPGVPPVPDLPEQAMENTLRGLLAPERS